MSLGASILNSLELLSWKFIDIMIMRRRYVGFDEYADKNGDLMGI